TPNPSPQGGGERHRGYCAVRLICNSLPPPQREGSTRRPDEGGFSMTAPTSKRPRLPVIDIARGVAIVAMAIYHLCWDLSYFRFIPVDVGYDPGWVLFARSILFSFMVLVGIGLVLAHGEGVRWRGFWRRLAFIAGGAALITLGTWLTFPESFVYF